MFSSVRLWHLKSPLLQWSPLITHHSSLITHHSSLITHHSSLITYHTSPLRQLSEFAEDFPSLDTSLHPRPLLGGGGGTGGAGGAGAPRRVTMAAAFAIGSHEGPADNDALGAGVKRVKGVKL